MMVFQVWVTAIFNWATKADLFSQYLFDLLGIDALLATDLS